MVAPIAELISKFKMHFISAPIRRACKAALADKQVDPVEVAYRSDEKYWVLMPQKNEVQVYFAVNFTNTTDISLARVMLLEWQDSQRKIKAPPNIKFHDKEVPTELTSKFPNAGKESYSNGMISFKLTLEHHLKGKDLEQPLSFFVGFRQFMNYHLHAMKQQLHSRMRKRVEIFERVINMAKRDKEGPKNWKETHGGISQEERELKEEKKVEEVFVHK
jgi:actin related protein 2/3 complex subunit 2